MKKLNKFFVFVLSLFCILGMVTPVFAEGENQVQLVSYEVIDNATSEKVSPNNDVFTLESGKTYQIKIFYKGEVSGDPIKNLADQLNCDILECLSSGGDSGQDENGELIYGYDAIFKVKKYGVKGIEIVSGKRINFSVPFTNEESVNFACDMLETWRNEKDGPLQTLDNRATKESVQERLYSDLGPYYVDVTINNFSLKKATQTEKGSISFDAVISRGGSTKDFYFQ